MPLFKTQYLQLLKEITEPNETQTFFNKLKRKKIKNLRAFITLLEDHCFWESRDQFYQLKV